jgi:hypothetical protein
MTETVQLALIAAVPPTIVASGALVVGILNNRKARAIEAKARMIEARAETIQVSVDGKMEELLELTRSGARAAGVVEGRESGVIERQARVTEAERVEDRADQKAQDLKTL